MAKRVSVREEPEPPAVQVIGDVARLVVQPGDALLVRVNVEASAAFYQAMRKELARLFPDVRVVIVPAEIDMQVVSQGANWAPAADDGGQD